jgi:hypothetical protein
MTLFESTFPIRCRLWLMLACLAFGLAHAKSPYPVVQLKDLPEPLRLHWAGLKPEMQPTSHCAAAFDSNTDTDKMVMKCSIHIKMSAEGERRAMRDCDEQRAERKIKAPCRLVEE